MASLLLSGTEGLGAEVGVVAGASGNSAERFASTSDLTEASKALSGVYVQSSSLIVRTGAGVMVTVSLPEVAVALQATTLEQEESHTEVVRPSREVQLVVQDLVSSGENGALGGYGFSGLIGSKKSTSMPGQPATD